MKKHLFISFMLFISLFASAQCDPVDYNWNGAAFGVSPDPLLGESFEVGSVGIAYHDVIYILVPTEAGDVDPQFEGAGTIDSLKLESVTVFNGVSEVDITAIGLNFSCNNNGDSPDPCTFMGGSAYCADLDGTPTMAGCFPLTINVIGYIQTFLGGIEVPYSFSDFAIGIDVADCTVGVPVSANFEMSLGQNTPNPATAKTEISFELSHSEEVKFMVSDLLGGTVFTQNIFGKRGSNTILFDTSELQLGIYLYSISVGEKKFTRRMVIQ